MAIQPIDLSTVFSQIDKAGQINANVLNTAQSLSAQSQLHGLEQAKENAKIVMPATENETSSTKVKADGKNTGEEQNGNDSEKKEKHNFVQNKKDEWEIEDPLLGQHIDISR